MAHYEEWETDFWNISEEKRRELEYFSKENGATEGKIHRFSEMLRKSVCVELGGCYAGDYNYLAVWKDILIFISCGVWD